MVFECIGHTSAINCLCPADPDLEGLWWQLWKTVQTKNYLYLFFCE